MAGTSIHYPPHAIFLSEALKSLLWQSAFWDFELANELGPWFDASKVIAGMFRRAAGRADLVLNASIAVSVGQHESAQVIKVRSTLRTAIEQLTTMVEELQRIKSNTPAPEAIKTFAAARRTLSKLRVEAEKLLTQMGHQQDRPAPVEKVVLSIDLADYSMIIAGTHEGAGAEGVAAVNDRIENFINKAIERAGLLVDQTVLVMLGDGGILGVEHADDAHELSCALYEEVRAYNSKLKRDVFAFRVGVSKGELLLRPNVSSTGELRGYSMAGIVISNAVRLQAKAPTNSILMDDAAAHGLSEKIWELYKAPRRVKGKHPGEEFVGRIFEIARPARGRRK